ncbi:MAG: glycerol-3-phosphate 1-O-acyltransferase PlsY [Gemmatimonadota bacterium]|nr:glycerol-3-phosphate 1-O-acyltransferase PlsY [Gemmatimonadota bacterium]
MSVVMWAAAAYLAGSVPAAWIAGRVAGIDLRSRGSGNLGATNTWRVLGPRAAIPVVLFDVLKGYLPAAYFPLLDGRAGPSLTLLYGGLAIAGHVWPVWLGFRGGKGVATGAGVLVALAPLAALVALLTWIGIVSLTRTVSLASLVAAACVPVVARVTDAGAEAVGFGVAAALFVFWTHRANLGRLRRGTELRFGGRDARAAAAEPEGSESTEGEKGRGP